MPDSRHPNTPLSQGIALFNQGHYYDCHDVLESLWMDADPVDKPFYQGMLQIAVGLYHLGNHNWQGATILLGEGVNRLRPFAPVYQGVAVDRLVDFGWAWLMALQQIGVEGIAELAQAAQVQLLDSINPPPEPEHITLTIHGDRLTLPVPLIYRVHGPPSAV